MSYIKVTCHLNSEDVEAVSDYFFSLACLGTELIESDFKNKVFDDNYGEIYTLTASDYPDVGIILIGYFEANLEMNELVIKQYLDDNNIEIVNHLLKVEMLDDIDYTNSWKDFFHEIKINEDISIVPSWYETIDDKINIKIEPGLGFGTGSHPTTYMCLKYLSEFIKPNDLVCDLGTGSGVIAILANILGAKKVYGIDLDKDALKNAKYNAEINQVSDIIWTSSGLNELKIKNDLIVANIVYGIIINLLPDISNSLNKNGLLIISGITKDKKNDIIIKLVENGFILIKSEEMKDFVSFVFRK
ncbi:MAG: prmA [Haloplasmataceae bacterium]|nr:prmA [Haloplasmataceae bacterium]